MTLPRFRANLVRAGDSSDIVAARNFDSAASILEAYARRIETQQELIGDLGKKISRANLALIPKTLFVTAAGTAVISAVSQSVFVDATAGNVALTVPTAVGNTGLTLNIYKTDTTTNTVTANGIVLGGNAGVSRLVLVSDGATYRTQVLYEEGTFTVTLAQCSSGGTGTVRFVRIGAHVTLMIPASVAGNSNGASGVISGIPASITPARAVAITGAYSILDNGISTTQTPNYLSEYIAVLTTSSTIQLYKNGGTTFTASGLKGLRTVSVPATPAVMSFSYTLQ